MYHSRIVATALSRGLGTQNDKKIIVIQPTM